MAQSKRNAGDDFDARYDAAVAAARAAREAEPHAKAARYDRESGRVVVDLLNGATFLFPAELVEGLRGAGPEQLAQVEVTPLGDGLHWGALDIDYSIANLLAGVFGSGAWMRQLRAEIAQRAGSATSPAKARAARENGKRGGRPRKSAGG